jgi:hypothetical protein
MLVFLKMVADFSRWCADGTVGHSILKTHPLTIREGFHTSTQHPVTLGSANKDSMLQGLVFPEHSPQAQPFKALALK